MVIFLRIKKKIPFSIFSAIILLILGFFLWASFYYQATERAVKFYSNNEYYVVEDRGSYISYKSKENTKDVAFIFYPGEKVEAKAYSPVAGKIAEKGYDVFISKMPLNLAVFNINAADKIVNAEKYPSYVIGGHSLGGVMASSYALKHDDVIKGLILLAAYPNGNTSFVGKDFKVVSLYGTEDKVLNLNKVENSKQLFDKNAVFESIEGGNQSAFGDYGKQKGDGDLKITQDHQEDITVDYIIGVLKAFKR